MKQNNCIFINRYFWHLQGVHPISIRWNISFNVQSYSKYCFNEADLGSYSLVDSNCFWASSLEFTNCFSRCTSRRKFLFIFRYGDSFSRVNVRHRRFPPHLKCLYLHNHGTRITSQFLVSLETCVRYLSRTFEESILTLSVSRRKIRTKLKY